MFKERFVQFSFSDLGFHFLKIFLMIQPSFSPQFDSEPVSACCAFTGEVSGHHFLEVLKLNLCGSEQGIPGGAAN